MERADGENTGPITERPLGRGDWIETAFALLISEGIDAVKITRLAEAMAVTRGSFYWHFKDRADLLDALISRWEGQNTSAVVAAVEDAADLTAGILSLFEAWTDIERFDPRLDSAMRDWARGSNRVRQVVEEADRRRVAAITALFERASYDPTEAFIRARIIYFSQVGYYALGIEESLVQRVSFVEDYFEGFTGRRLDPAVAEEYRARHLGDVGKRRRA